MHLSCLCTGQHTPGGYTRWLTGTMVPNSSPPAFQDQEALYTYFILSAVSSLCAVLEREMLVITCPCFHLGKLRKRDSLWLIIFQISACIRVRTLFTVCGPYILTRSWKDKVNTHQNFPPQHVPMCSATQSCLGLFAIPWTVAARVYPRQEYWSGLPFPPPGDLLDPEIKPTCLLHLMKLAGGLFITSATREAPSSTYFNAVITNISLQKNKTSRTNANNYTGHQA